MSISTGSFSSSFVVVESSVVGEFGATIGSSSFSKGTPVGEFGATIGSSSFFKGTPVGDIGATIGSSSFSKDTPVGDIGATIGSCKSISFSSLGIVETTPFSLFVFIVFKTSINLFSIIAFCNSNIISSKAFS